MKLVVNDKDGKSYAVELGDKGKLLVGKRIGDTIPGDLFGLPGYELKLTGGSDNSGFPMRKGITGSRKVKVLLSSPPGFRPKKKGERRRKTVRGEVYSEEISEVNAVVVKQGAKPLSELLGKKEEKKENEAG